MSVNPPELFPAFAGTGIGSNSSSDDDYGDFVFSSPCSLHAPSTIPSSALALDAAADEDDWGDFLAIPLGSQSFHLQSSSPSSLTFDPSSDAFPADPSSPKTSLAVGARWEKHMGALPLSIFGEEEPEEPEQIDGPGVLGNGFDSSPSRNHSSLKRAPSGQLKDLIESLYGQDCVGTDGARARSLEEDNSFDDGTWDFKVALSAYTGEQIDEAEGANFGFEMLASITENGDSKIVVNRSDMDHLEIRSDERGPVDVSVGNEGFTNTLSLHNISVSEMPLHELFPSLGNETISIESTNQLKTNFCRSNTNGSINKTSDDQQELCHPPDDSEDIKEVRWTIWDNHDLNVTTDAVGKNDSNGKFEDHIKHDTDGRTDSSPVSVSEILGNLYDKANRLQYNGHSHGHANNGKEMDQHRQSSAYINGDDHFDQFDWDFRNAAGTGETEKLPDHESQSFPNVSTSCNIVVFYCRLKEESLSFIAHHLRALKVLALPENTPHIKITREIQEAYRNLQESRSSESAFNSHSNQLLNFMGVSYFKNFEQEYHLSERLLSAEKDLNSAIKLFEHSCHVLEIMRASREQQLAYINAWSKLAFASAKELEYGSKIWTESLDGNVGKLLLAEGKKYFISLGEVYRVSKILKTSVRLYMPWLLCNVVESSELLTSLEKCDEAWASGGLQEVLRTMSENKNLDDNNVIKSLLGSIKLIDDVDQTNFPDMPFVCGQQVCKFSLLPLGSLQGVSSVDWNGERYATKLANFWANQISPNPPELPLIKISKLTG